jgi:uncharacterized protein YbjT (DUF2867 family)
MKFTNVTEHIAILGGSGFVGRHLVRRFLAKGHSVTVLTRQTPEMLKGYLAPAMVRQVANDSDRQLVQALSGASVLINLAGILHESHGQYFEEVHAELPARLVKACSAAGVRQYLHMSALRADMANPPSAYLQSKAHGEQAACTALGDLTVALFRPSIIFGDGDNFFGQFAQILRWMPVFPLVCPNSRFSPVWVGDVVSAFLAVIGRSAKAGSCEAFELCGPNTYSFRELIDFTVTALGRRRLIIGVPDWAARLQGRTLQHLPRPLFTLDNYHSLQADSVCECNDLERLDIKPAALEAIMTPLLAKTRSG